MKSAAPKNMADSVKARLSTLARASGEDFAFVLTRFVLERVLYRLANSPHANSFLLKGATLFCAWSKTPHRATKDIDLLRFGAPDRERLASIFVDVLQTPSIDDGLRFDVATVHAEAIREEAVYDGIRVTFLARVGTARVPVQIDVGFGDASVPSPEWLELPPMLDLPAPRMKGYCRELVVAEKFHAMVDRGLANSRMKDYFDVWYLAGHFSFESARLASAITHTFDRRKTPLPQETPIGLTDAFAEDSGKQVQWTAFVRRVRLEGKAPTLLEATMAVRALLMPLIESMAINPDVRLQREPNGPWHESGGAE